MIKRFYKLAVLLVVLQPSYSYSDYVFDTSSVNAYNWVMTNVLPQQAGLQVNSVFYRYTTVKETEDEMIVYVENEDPNGGYVFRSIDNWTGLPGNTINKLVSTGGVTIDRWGDGSITWTGAGEVIDPSVVYSYQYDPCFDPQSNPECPGYKPEIPDIYEPEIVDPLNNDFVQDEIDRKMTMRDEDEEENDRKRMEEKEEEENEEEVDLEQMFGVINESLQTSLDTAKMNQLTTLNAFSSMYFQQIPDTKYEETVVLDGGTIPRNRRNNLMLFTQQKLHNDLIKLQYQK